jgi:hypothetical protein
MHRQRAGILLQYNFQKNLLSSARVLHERSRVRSGPRPLIGAQAKHVKDMDAMQRLLEQKDRIIRVHRRTEEAQ